MGTRCAIGICNNYLAKTKKQNQDIKYHSFPRDPVMRKKWIQSCYRNGPINPATSRICSLHFKEEDYERDLKAELLGITWTRKRLLKPTAVPTVNVKPGTGTVQEFIPSISHKNRKKLSKKRAQKEIVQQLLEDTRPDTCVATTEEVTIIPTESQDENVVSESELTDLRNERDNLLKENEKLQVRMKVLQKKNYAKARLIKRLQHKLSSYEKNQQQNIVSASKILEKLETDAENWIEFQMIGKRLILKAHVVPHKNIFENLQLESESQLSPSARKRKIENILRLESKKAATNRNVGIHVKPETCDVEIQVDLLNAPKLTLLKPNTSDNQPSPSTREEENTTCTGNIEQVYIKEEQLEMDHNDSELYEELRNSAKKELVNNENVSDSGTENIGSVHHKNIKTENVSVFEYVNIKQETFDEEFNQSS